MVGDFRSDSPERCCGLLIVVACDLEDRDRLAGVGEAIDRFDSVRELGVVLADLAGLDLRILAEFWGGIRVSWPW